MKIIIQKIAVDWTKKSRGAPLSNLRNSVSEYYKINYKSTIPDNNCLYHEVKLQEITNFKPVEKYDILEVKNKKIELLPIKLEIDNNSLKVKFFHTTTNCGLPKRKYTQHLIELFELNINEMGIVQYNGRISHGYWLYLKCIFRIYFVDDLNLDSINKMVSVESFVDEADLF